MWAMTGCDKDIKTIQDNDLYIISFIKFWGILNITISIKSGPANRVKYYLSYYFNSVKIQTN